jgi:SAM-dependent methyltransferase
MTTAPYLLDNHASDARPRFAALSALFDAGTARHLDDLGVGPGWRCWEVGAGGPAVPRLLADRVDPGGTVLATDVDVSHLAEAVLPASVTVHRHDVAVDLPPGGGFDLVHARLVLTHVPARLEALRRMAAALRPGGWLLVEDFDVRLMPAACPGGTGPVRQRADRLRAGFVTLLAQRGVDLEFGRALPRLLRGCGLTDVGADAAFPLVSAATAELEAANVRQVADELVAGRFATAWEVRAHLGALAAGELDIATPPLVSVWGRRPGVAL